jgi:hypothetical protein
VAKLFGLVAAVSVATVAGLVFFRRKNKKPSRWTSTKDSAVSLTKTAAQGGWQGTTDVTTESWERDVITLEFEDGRSVGLAQGDSCRAI